MIIYASCPCPPLSGLCIQGLPTRSVEGAWAHWMRQPWAAWAWSCLGVLGDGQAAPKALHSQLSREEKTRSSCNPFRPLQDSVLRTSCSELQTLGIQEAPTRLETSHDLGILSWRYSPLSPFPLPHQQLHLPTWRCKHGPPDPLQEEGYSVQFSLSVVSKSLQPHGLQHARPPCPSPTLRVYSNSCPLSQWCHPTISSSVIPFSSCLHSFPKFGVFSDESVLHIRWPKFWSSSFSISPSNEYSGLISFRMDWLDLLAGQGTLKSLLQHHSSKASILWCSAFFIVQLSHPYMTTGKTIALTRRTFIGKVMSLLFNMLSRLVITFLARSKWSKEKVVFITIFLSDSDSCF